MDLVPTFARILEASLPDERYIDGIGQSIYLFGQQAHSGREYLLTFTGNHLAALRWRKWRGYAASYHLSGGNPSLGGHLGDSAPAAGYPMMFNIEAGPREMRNTAAEDGWVMGPYLEGIGHYRAALADRPSPPAPNLTGY